MLFIDKVITVRVIRAICLFLFVVSSCVGSAIAETNDEQLAALERLLDERAEGSPEFSVTGEVADVAGRADFDRALREAQQRIATLEQLVADRDAIITELSRQQNVPADEGDLEALRANNEALKAQLATVTQERDQIRVDFNRLFEGGEFAQPAEGSEELMAEKEKLTKRVSSLEMQLSQLTAHLSEVVGEKNALAEKLAEREAEPAGNDAVIAEMDSELTKMRDTVDTLEAALQESEAARASLVVALEEQTAPLDKRLLDLTARNESLATELAQAQRARTELQEQIRNQPDALSESDIMQELSALRELDASRRQTMDELMLKVSGLRDMLSQRDAQVEVLQTEIVQLKDKLQEAAQDVQDKDEFTSNLRSEIESLGGKIKTLQSKIDDQFDEFSALQKYAKDKENELSALQERFQTLEKEHAKIIRNYGDLRDANEVQGAELGQLRSILEQRDEQIQSLQVEMAETLQIEERRQRLLDETLARLAQVEEREKTLITQKSELESSQARLQEQRDGLQAEVESLQGQVASLQQDKRAVTAAEQAVQDTLAKREQALADATAESASLKKSNEALKEELATVQSDVASLREELTRVQTAHTESQQQLVTLQAEMAKVRLVDQTRKTTLDDTLAKLAVAEQAKASLETQVATVDARSQEMTQSQQAEILDLQAKNDALEEELVKMEQDLALALEGAYTAVAPTNETDLAAQLVALEARNASLAGQLEQLRMASEVNGAVAGMEQPGTETPQYTELKLALEASQREVEQLQDALLAKNASSGAEGETSGEVAVLLEQLGDQRRLAVEASTEVEGLSAALAIAQTELQRLAQGQGVEPGAEEQASARVAALTAELAATQAELSRARAENVQGTTAPVNVRETDLYKELEQNNNLTREALQQAESERKRLKQEVTQLSEQIAAIASSKEDMQGELAAAMERETEYRELIDRLVPEVRSLEEQVTELRRMREAMSARLLKREEDVNTLQVELEKREHRLARAERVADVLEQTRSEVEQAQQRQRLNMHYNMASVYAREGRFEEAEYEYLQALRLDPSDADVHYNLGILYDDQLKQPEKALLHYRRYLQLNPHGEDADSVRNWVMRLEMREQR